ncbi:hypothetical protein LSTR_LSTR002226 [Laodelphax striatellus]|uniref:Histone acetyltransferase n=1 Tax=Laodelphax striatellus TaxID=195883 RepID=A0A482XF99_LAOST|nr:hypothetical protein LSTR_LSTR002226 [Laodelphax striatellus]
MTSKKKEAASSSESSTSNTSTSSSTSSSSSGSESSSSDSDNSSTSANKSAPPSTDSDSKKKTATAKKKVNPPPVNKNKTENKNDSIATSEVEPPQKNVKEKVVPKSKQVAQQKAAPVYSSESDDGNTNAKSNTKRKSPTKPKASATVTPVTKTSKPAPRVLAKKPVAVVKSSTNKNSNVKDTKSAKTDTQKKSKTKSIFSPDNSSESDGHNATPPPPKLTAMKSVATNKAAVAAAAAMKAKPKGKKDSMSTSDKSRASSASSNSSQGSGASSGSSSDSDSSVESTATSRVKTAATPVKVRSVGRPRKTPPAASPATAPAASATAHSSPADQGSSEQGGAPSAIQTRKLTRSVSARGRSKHLTGRLGSDSESESESKSTLTKSPVKKAGPKGPASQRKPKARGSSESGQSLLNEVRKCPVEGCDSSGHLSGKLEKHFTIEACPVYHNRTPQACKEAVIERKKREEERKKAIASLKPLHASNPTPEQKAYRQKVKELKSVHEEGSSGSERERNNNNNNNLNKEKEPLLYKFAPKYDLKMFQEAQAIVSESIEEELSKLPSTKGTKYIEMGKFEMEVWYQSPYPDDYARLPKLYLCEYCLRYMKSRAILNRHAVKCVWRHPPGEEVYRKDKISVWEVDGKRYKPYSQNLCLLAKFFLDHKTLYYDVEPFLFYVMTINDNEGCHTVGYFSKEKNSFLNYNVSCILMLPPYQRQGYGRLLIDFSYLLTRVEGKIGSPEKPLSDLGLISYRSYWKDVLLEYLCNLGGKQLSVKDISQEMAINSYDIVSTLQALGMMKYWKGKHIILKKQDVIEEYVERSKKRGLVYKEIDPSCLRWTPFVAPSPSTAS